MRFEVLKGAGISSSLKDLALLRIAVFREWPYLYDGDLAYESRYLSHLAEAPQGIIVVARSENTIVGAATAMPLHAAEEGLRKPFADLNIQERDVYYFGESVLLSPYRGQGVGHKFFDHREAEARRGGFSFAAFCAVMRPESHSARPSSARTHEAFWQKRGYEPCVGIKGVLSWKELSETVESEKEMQFWIKTLS